MKRKMRGRRAAALAAAILTVAGIMGHTYLNKNYPAHALALQAMESTEAVTVYKPTEDMLVFAAEESEAGFIFYPGGKVEHIAYAPLLHALAQKGITCVLPKMPFDLAVLNMDAAQQVREKVAGIETWYIGGHSLGGAMAANFAAEHPQEYEGLVLLAAYATKDLKQNGLKVISLYGSEDRVLNMEKYKTYSINLPEDTVEMVLDGGNHAQFGSYGPQSGDGTALVSMQEQIAWAVDIISGEILNDDR